MLQGYNREKSKSNGRTRSSTISGRVERDTDNLRSEGGDNRDLGTESQKDVCLSLVETLEIMDLGYTNRK